MSLTHAWYEVDCSELQAVIVSVKLLQCHHLVEAKEEVIENWWFKHYAKGVDTDLNSFLCVSRMKGWFCSLPKVKYNR